MYCLKVNVVYFQKSFEVCILMLGTTGALLCMCMFTCLHLVKQIYFYSDNFCCIRVVETTVAKYLKKKKKDFGLAQVCWYRIYGREVKGVNLKVRIGDCHLVGTGETVGCMLLYKKYCTFKTYPLNQFIKCKYKIIK